MKDPKSRGQLLAVIILLVCTYLVLSFFLLKESMLLSRRFFVCEVAATAFLLVAVYVRLLRDKGSS